MASIEGFRGDGLTAANDVDARTVTAADDPGVVDVNVNQTNPNTFTTGGATEFHITDPVVALSGSGTADAPYLRITLNTTNATGITVQYNVRDIDGSTDNAPQQVALHYRVGTSGVWTDVAAAYIADATTGPSVATQVTAVNVTLPAAAENQPSVQLRIMTTNAAGNDEWVGLDDIVISATCSAVDTAPSVSGNTPANGATDVALATNITINFSEAVNTAAGWFSVVCDVSGDISSAVTVSGGPLNFTLDPTANLQYGDDCTVTVNAAMITDQDSDDPPDAMAANHVFSFSTPATDPCLAAFTPIYDIQGSGTASPLSGSVTTLGVVTSLYRNLSGVNGFFIQDAVGDSDNNTSDGLYIFLGAFGATVQVGDLVRVQGTVQEFYDLTELSSLTSVQVCSTGNSVAATPVSLPLPDSSYWERYEGMVIDIQQRLTAVENYFLGRYGEIGLSSVGQMWQYTQTDTPDVTGYAARLEEIARSTFVLNDGRSNENPDPLIHPAPGLDYNNTLRNGAYTSRVTGILNYTFDDYKIEPLNTVTFVATNPRPTGSPAVGGTLKVVSMNTLNYFTTMGSRGASNATEFTRQSAKLVNVLMELDADIVGLMEIENNTAAIQDLITKLNTALGSPVYDYIDTGVIGTDVIKVALIYKTTTVTPVGAFAILDDSVDPTFYADDNRPVLAQTFEEIAGGERFTVAVNHLKSKGSACDVSDGGLNDPDIGDGQGNCNLTREAAAQAEVNWLAADPTGSGDPDFLLIGDMNSYANEDPIVAFEAGDYTNLLERFGGAHAYSYVFDGQLGYLDHALANSSLLPQVIGAGEWHINADEPSALDYDMTYKSAAQDTAWYSTDPIRAADHDPLVIGLRLFTDEEDGGDTSTPGGSPDTGIFDPALSKVGVLPAGGIGLTGEQLTWVITVTNRGTGAGTNIVVSDTVRAELRIDRVETERGSFTTSGQTVTFSIPWLNPGESVQLRIITTVLRSPLDGLIVNDVALSGTAPNGDPASATARGVVNTAGTLPSTGYPPADESGDSSSVPAPLIVLAGALVVGLVAGGWVLRRKIR